MERQPKGRPTGGQFASGDSMREEVGQIGHTDFDSLVEEALTDVEESGVHVDRESFTDALRDSDLYEYNGGFYLNDKAEESDYKALYDLIFEHAQPSDNPVDVGLNDDDWRVRTEAAASPEANVEQLDRAMGDTRPNVRAAAAKNPNATTEQLDQALDDDNYTVRRAAVLNSNATAGHLDRALKDVDPAVRVSVLVSPNVTPEHINRARNDRNKRVRELARKAQS